MNIVLMAGGGGTRLWPLSRQSLPKQFLAFDGSTTLLEQAYERAASLTSPERIFVATGESYRAKTEQVLPQVAAERVFCEPERRDTTAAFASVCVRLTELGFGDEPTIFMWSDHVFTDQASFLRDLGRIEGLITGNPQALIIMGHTPLSAETGLGYVKVKEPLASESGVYVVDEFKEKPDAATAEEYVASGDYFWNLGYFSLKPSYLLAQLQELSPETTPAIEAFMAAHAAGDEAGEREAYRQFPKVSIEYTFVEKTSTILMVASDYGWSDVGNWAAVQDVFGVDGDHVPQGHHVHVDSDSNFIYNTTTRAVSTIGMNNTIVVVTDDAILVTDKKSAAKVKEVVQELEAKERTEFL